jgi:regulation of enolase protein 1 (concanavalin A-like superfamily)
MNLFNHPQSSPRVTKKWLLPSLLLPWLALALSLPSSALFAQVVQTVTWAGGNSYKSWIGATNWSPQVVPLNNAGTNFTAIVGAGSSMLFDAPGARAVSSLNLGADSSLRFQTNANLNVQNVAFVGGLLEARVPGAGFTADAFGTSLGVNARVVVEAGSHVTIAGTPGSRYDWNVNNGASPLFSVDGTNSLLDLSDLAQLSVNGYYFNPPKVIQAVNSGHLDFSGLVAVTGARTDGYPLQFHVANKGQLDLPMLRTTEGYTHFDIELPSFTLPALESAGSTWFELTTNSLFRVPKLASTSGTSSRLTVPAGATFEATNLLSMSDTIVDLSTNGTANLPRLTTFANSRVDLNPSTHWIVPPPANVNNARFSVSGGTTFAVAAASYDWTYNYGDNSLFTADGASSLLDLKSLQSLSLNYVYLNTSKTILAANSGKIDLSGLKTVTGARTDGYPLVFRVTSGGMVDLGSLQTVVGGNLTFRVESGEWTLPALVAATNTAFEITPSTTLHTPALTVLGGANTRIDLPFVGTLDAPNLRRIYDAQVNLDVSGTLNAPQLQAFINSTVTLSPGRSFLTGALTNIDNSTIIVSGSNNLAIIAPSYDWTYNYGRSPLFSAEGDGCVLNLASIRRLSLNGCYMTSEKEIAARLNGRLDLSSLDDIYGARSDASPLVFKTENGGLIQLGNALVRGKTALRTAGDTSKLKAPSLTLASPATLSLTLNGALELSRGLTFNNTVESEISLEAGRLRFVGGGAQFLEVASLDGGIGGTGLGNFGIGQLTVGADGLRAALRLQDRVDNGNRVGISPEALYLTGGAYGRSLDLLGGSTLVLNGINVYALVGGQIIRLNSLIPSGTNSVAFEAGFIALSGGPLITNMTPSVAVTPPVSWVDVAFDQPIQASSFTPSDVNITGPGGSIPATGVAPVGGTTWRISFAPQSADGTYTVKIGPAINEVAANLLGMDQNGDGLSGDGTNDTFVATFIIDSTAPVVTAAYGLQKGNRVGVTFDEFVPDASATNPANYLVNGQTPTRVEVRADVQINGSGILREVFQGISGNNVSDLTSSPIYPGSPTSTSVVTDAFEAPRGFGDNYGQRMHGYIVPPVTGNYVFWIASDDGGALYLSTDENLANQRLIASVSIATGWRNWSGQSAAIALQAGKPYYIAALQKEGSGDDYLSVRWLRPDGGDEGPVPATYLLPYGSLTPRSLSLRSRMVLDVPALVGDSFNLVTSNLGDLLGNRTNRTVLGTILPLSPKDLGNPGSDPREPGSTVAYSDSIFDMVAGGSGIWYDYGHFLSELRTGDFDTAVRIQSQTRVGSWTQSGIMARESLDATSREVYAGIQYGTGYNRFTVIHRASTGGGSDYWPNSTVNTVPIPNAWLRLKREGSVFIASRGTTGTDWVELARVTNSLPATVYVGLASSANNNNVGGTTSVQYRDFREISPAIITHPQLQRVASGANVTFGVTARGLPVLAYQWQLNGVALPGETNSLLQLLAVTTNRVGGYRVVVSNSYGSTTSQEATLMVDGTGCGSFEADVAPRPNGNNAITVSDWVQVGRAIAGLDPVMNSCEFQRVDCAPRTNALLGTLPLGDGRLSVVDWTQAGRYAAGVDPLTDTGGPTAPVALVSGGNSVVLTSGSRAKDGAVRSLSLLGGKTALGQSFAVPVELLALGGENALGFSVLYDPARLAYQSASLGDGAAGAALQVNASQAPGGSVGVVLAKSVGQSFSAGTATVVRLQFRAVGTTGTNSVAFGDAPVWREVADVGAEVQPAAYIAGTVRVVSPGRLSPDVRLNPGSAELRLSGEPGERYRVEVSRDLVDWSPVSTVAAGNDPVVVHDTAAGWATQRFYRAVLAP